jgi:hypothetical protein
MRWPLTKCSHRITSKFYAIERLLDEKLNYRASRTACIHNASHPAHTSLDSLYKYRELQDKSFDLVIIYHGINKTRANNCPPHVFQADYSHYAWCLPSDDRWRHPLGRACAPRPRPCDARGGNAVGAVGRLTS